MNSGGVYPVGLPPRSDLVSYKQEASGSQESRRRISLSCDTCVGFVMLRGANPRNASLAGRGIIRVATQERGLNRAIPIKKNSGRELPGIDRLRFCLSYPPLAFESLAPATLRTEHIDLPLHLPSTPALFLLATAREPN